MAVKASATISIYRIKEVTSTTNYYLLQSSTAAAPSKPTTDSPGGKWTTSEPAYTDGSTLTLYTVIKTKYSDNTFEYTPVSKSTSYEAAKSAYNKAQAAQNSATSANNKIDNLEVGGRNYIKNSNFANENMYLWIADGATKQLENDSVYNKVMKITYSGANRRVYYATPNAFWNKDNYYIVSFMAKGSTEGVSLTASRSIVDLSNTVTLSTSWDRYICKIKSTATIASGGTLSIQINKDSAYITNIKLEKGNKATDWTAAPEDFDNVVSQYTAPKDTSAVWFNTHDNLFYKYNGEDWIAVSDYNEDISKLKEDVGKIDSTIDGKINSYNDEIKNTYYTKAQVDSQIETNERGIKEYYSGTLQTIREDTTGLSNRITAIEGYIQKGLDDNGQPFVELGTQASPYKLKITNDAIQITYLGEPVSNWKQDLIELNTVITSYLNLGKFSFVINSDDSLSFRKIR